MQVRICPECGEEYRPEIVSCADCGALLEDADGDRAPRIEAPPPSPESGIPEGYEPIFWGSQPREIQGLAERLTQADLPFHVHARPADGQKSGLRLALLVPQAERARALTILAPHLDAEADPALLQALEREFDPATGYRRCPACDRGLDPGATECPECGLAVAETGPPCPRCGKAVFGENENCPDCSR
ncbi:MAG TPA: hypothetical protein VJU18_19130 [Vicinamibacteria bacterium]|nr:hypothetical protein [Vicinamibacteria bacterium]